MDKSSKIIVYAGIWRYFWRYCLAFILLAVTASGCAQHHVLYQPPEPGQCILDPRTVSFYQRWKGTPYLWGGEDRRGIDCSAFMQKAYRFLYNQKLPRTTREQMQLGSSVAFSRLRKGDLLFFRTGWQSDHVGMYLGHNRFLHAGTSSGVTISSLSPKGATSTGYWWSCYRGARRF